MPPHSGFPFGGRPASPEPPKPVRSGFPFGRADSPEPEEEPWWQFRRRPSSPEPSKPVHSGFPFGRADSRTSNPNPDRGPGIDFSKLIPDGDASRVQFQTGDGELIFRNLLPTSQV